MNVSYTYIIDFSNEITDIFYANEFRRIKREKI